MIKHLNKNKGQTMVEFALGLIILSFVALAIFEFGRLLQTWITIQNAAQSAGRYAITGQQSVLPSADTWDTARINAIRAEARRLAATLMIIDGAAATDPGYFLVRVFASDPPAAGSEYPGGPNARVAVDVIYNYQLITPFLARMIPIITLTAHSELVNERFRHPGYGTPAGALPPTIMPTPTPITTVSFERASQSAAEATIQTVRLVLSTAAGSNVTVYYTLSGSATAGADYTVNAPSPVTIPAGTTSVTILTTVNDTLDENDETVMAAFSSAPVGAGIRNPTSNSTTILDDDFAPTLSFTLGSSNITEGSNSSVQLRLSAVSGRDVLVNFAPLGGTASLGVDYDLTPSPITIPAGSTTAGLVFTTSAFDDPMDEENETVPIQLGTLVNALPGTPSTHVVTILDNDNPPQIFFEKSVQYGVEGTTSLVRVRLTAPSGKVVTIPFSIGSGSTATDGTDYFLNPQNFITFPSGSSYFDISMQLVSDAITEPDETVVFNLGSPTNATLGTPSSLNFTILPPDALPPVYFELASSTANEDAGSVQINVLLMYAWTQDVSVNLVASGRAYSGLDYTLSSTILVIPAGQTQGSVIVNLINDDTYEEPETLDLLIDSVTNGTIGAPAQHTLTIISEDVMPFVYFAEDLHSHSEDAGTVYVVVLSSVSSLDVVVPISVRGDSTATPGSDYTMTTTSVTIPAFSTSATIPVTIINDTLIGEPNEYVYLVLGPPTGATLGYPDVHSLRIIDDDVPDCPQTVPGSQGIVVSGSKVYWNLEKNTSASITLTRVLVRWSRSWRRLTSIVFSGASPLTIYTGSLPYPQVVRTGSWNLNFLQQSTIYVGQLIFEFDGSMPSSGYNFEANFQTCPTLYAIK